MYACPVCDAEFKAFDLFQPSPSRPGRRALCPSCKCLERARHIWFFFTRNNLLAPGKWMLEIAPSRGLMNKLRSVEGLNYVTACLDRDYVDVRFDLTGTPFETRSFNLIYCSNVLEHIVDDAAAIAELYRICKTGGLTIVQVPRKNMDKTEEDPNVTSPEERDRLYGQPDHVRYYGRDVKQRLEKPGFRVQQFITPDELDVTEAEIERYGMDKKELIFLCYK